MKMKKWTIMIKPASSLCNMRCNYCFYTDVSNNRITKSYGIMEKKTVDAVINQIYADLSDGESLSITFQGGEPTLAGLSWFEYFISAMKRQTKHVYVNYSLQTNAILLDNDWCKFLKANHFLVGVSLDGPEDNHNNYRLDTEGKGTYKKVMNAIALLNEYGIDYNILMTLTNPLARHPQKVWKFIVDQNFRYVQFTPCLSEMNAVEHNPYELTPKRFASFYTQIFCAWKKEFDKGNYYSIKLFDDLINLLAFGEVNACGLTGICSPQIVVEADGSVYPCDFYMLDEWKVGNLTTQSVEKIAQSEMNTHFCERSCDKHLCLGCKYQSVCNGNCQRMRKQIAYNESENECGYKEFLNHTIGDMKELAIRHRNYYK